jgi:hypothetical protein
METIQRLEELMKSHDWFYDYSDDHRIWERGRTQRAEIYSTADALRSMGYSSEVDRLFEEYVPKL